MRRRTIKTYTIGIRLLASAPLTKDGMLTLCRALEQRFGDGSKFQPDGVGGGFIKWSKWPGQTEAHGYKCMRLGTNHAWPFVADVATWVGNNEVIVKEGKSYSTFLKAFDAAPAWTEEELATVAQCLEEVCGFVMLESRRRKLKPSDSRRYNKMTLGGC
jgi:ABC-type nitrate/sulfonate/bicarbonate transport system substrate-binding protein